jgi:hypothetical protein
MPPDARIERVSARSFRIPTDAPEADRTMRWEATTLILAEIEAGRHTGIGYTYADAACVTIINGLLGPVLRDRSPFAIPALWVEMVGAPHNAGWRGIRACAISAIDVALWDLKSRLLDVPVSRLLGHCRDSVPIYGSGGFTSYSLERLGDQLSEWVARLGCRWVKMKVGAVPEHDLERVKVARAAIGSAGLYVGANGAYQRKDALNFARQFAELGVIWFEEPVSSDDLEGLRLLRDRAPAGMEIAAGEYGYEPLYHISVACWRPAPSMYCRPMPRDAVATRAFSRPRLSQMLGAFPFPLIRLPHCISPSVALHRACATSNGFTTMRALKGCYSTERPIHTREKSAPISSALVTVSRSNTKTPTGWLPDAGVPTCVTPSKSNMPRKEVLVAPTTARQKGGWRMITQAALPRPIANSSAPSPAQLPAKLGSTQAAELSMLLMPLTTARCRSASSSRAPPRMLLSSQPHFNTFEQSKLADFAGTAPAAFLLLPAGQRGKPSVECRIGAHSTETRDGCAGGRRSRSHSRPRQRILLDDRAIHLSIFLAAAG